MRVYDAILARVPEVAPTHPRRDAGPNDQRDSYLYDLRVNQGKKLEQILMDLASHPEWEQIESIPGISQAIKRYANRVPKGMI
jgi:hypothetical protein